MRAAVLRYRVMAYVTGVVLIVLCVLAVLQAFVNDGALVNIVGTMHGILYIIYVIAGYLASRSLRLKIGPTTLVLLAGTIPVLTFVVERWVTRKFISPAMAARANAGAPAPAPTQPLG